MTFDEQLASLLDAAQLRLDRELAELDGQIGVLQELTACMADLEDARRRAAERLMKLSSHWMIEKTCNTKLPPKAARRSAAPRDNGSVEQIHGREGWN